MPTYKAQRKCSTFKRQVHASRSGCHNVFAVAIFYYLVGKLGQRRQGSLRERRPSWCPQLSSVKGKPRGGGRGGGRRSSGGGRGGWRREVGEVVRDGWGVAGAVYALPTGRVHEHGCACAASSDAQEVEAVATVIGNAARVGVAVAGGIGAGVEGAVGPRVAGAARHCSDPPRECGRRDGRCRWWNSSCRAPGSCQSMALNSG